MWGLLRESRLGRLWRDPEMKAFREAFVERMQKDFLAPLEAELGTGLGEYASLVQGQLTLALTPGDKGGQTREGPGWLLLLDTRERSEQLEERLAELRRKWAGARRPITTDRIRNVEFTALTVSRGGWTGRLEHLFSPEVEPEAVTVGPGVKSSGKADLLIGQSGSVLILTASRKDAERVLICRDGGLGQALGDLPDYQALNRGLFRDACAFGFVKFQPLADIFFQQGDKSGAAAADRQSLFRPERVLDSTGLRGLEMMAFALKTSSEGSLWQLSARVPEADRRGLFTILAVEPKDSGPPPFVPADAVRFTRWRVDGAKVWGVLEKTISEVSPQISGVLQMMLGSVGKDKDPGFDFRKSVIGNLGDDLITLQMLPRGVALADLASPPSLVLIGSANADRLLAALCTSSSLVSDEPGSLKEREVLGTRIYTLPLPTPSMPGMAQVPTHNVHLAARGGYVAVTSDLELVEEYLRSGVGRTNALRETVGLKEAAERVGGMSTGTFRYENTAGAARAMFAFLKSHPDALMAVLPPHYFLLLRESRLSGPLQYLLGECDFALLPAFEKVSRYFSFSVSSLAVTREGIDFTLFVPVPPGLRQQPD
jgi:hypothetical protein